MAKIRPATPPPDFDLALANRTLARYKALAPAAVYLAHYGAVDPPLEALDEATERLAEWMGVAESAYREHSELDHLADTLAQHFAHEMPSDPDQARPVQLLSGFRSNAMGMLRYFQLRDEGRVTPEA
jgi:hypothetical protein